VVRRSLISSLLIFSSSKIWLIRNPAHWMPMSKIPLIDAMRTAAQS
jgi:hypothetical protein